MDKVELMTSHSHLDTVGLVEIVEGANPEADGGPELVIRHGFPHGEETPVKGRPFLLAKVGCGGSDVAAREATSLPNVSSVRRQEQGFGRRFSSEGRRDTSARVQRAP